MTFRLSIGQRSAGRNRFASGDVVAISEEDRFALIADGFGGQVGKNAAEAAVAAAVEALGGGHPMTTVMASAHEAAHRIVVDSAAVGNAGVSLVAAAFGGGVLRLAHVGHARAYLCRQGPLAFPPEAANKYVPTVQAQGRELCCLTQDHTSVCSMVERGHLTRERGLRHPLRARVTKALGSAQPPSADLFKTKLHVGDRLLLCSDGAWDCLQAEELLAVLAGGSAQAACDELAQRAQAQGARDDVSILVVAFDDEDSGDTPRGDQSELAPPR